MGAKEHRNAVADLWWLVLSSQMLPHKTMNTVSVTLRKPRIAGQVDTPHVNRLGKKRPRRSLPSGNRRGTQWPEENAAVNTMILQLLQQPITIERHRLIHDNRGHPETIDHMGWLRIHLHRKRREQLSVAQECLTLFIDEVINSLQLRTTDGRLDVAHLVLESNPLRPELPGFPPGSAVVGQREHLLVELGVIGDEHPTFSRGQRLGAMKGKDAETAQAAGPPAMPLGTNRFSGVFDDRDAVALTDVEQPIHGAEIAIKMNRHNGLGSRGDAGFHLSRVQAPGIGKNVDEHRLSPEVDDRSCRGHPVGVRHDHFVSWSYPKRMQAHVQRPGATARGKSMVNAEVLTKGLLKANDVVIAMLPPSIAGRIGGIGHLQIRDGRPGVRDSGELEVVHGSDGREGGNRHLHRDVDPAAELGFHF